MTKTTIRFFLLILLSTLLSCASDTVTHMVTYDSNASHNGEGAILSKLGDRVADGATISLPTATTRPNGYHLIGFSTDSSAVKADFSPSLPIKNDLTLYAIWSDSSTITYKIGSATGGAVPKPQVKPDSTPLTLSLNTGSLKKDDEVFLCWNTQEDGKGTDYREGGSLTQEGDLTLYPRWCVTYAVGEADYLAKMWKNGGKENGGETLSLTSSTQYSSDAFDIAVLDDDVYVAGSDASTTIWKAMLWKNGGSLNHGETTTLPTTEKGESHAMELVVSGKDIYVGGSEAIDGTEWATIWKNGNILAQKNLGFNYASQHIAVSGDTIYVVGNTYDSSSSLYTYSLNVASYNETDTKWTTKTLLFDNNMASFAITVAADEITISASNQTDSHSIYQWKKHENEENWKETTLTTPDDNHSNWEFHGTDSNLFLTDSTNLSSNVERVLTDGSMEKIVFPNSDFPSQAYAFYETEGESFMIGQSSSTTASIWKQDVGLLNLESASRSAIAYAMVVIEQ